MSQTKYDKIYWKFCLGHLKSEGSGTRWPLAFENCVLFGQNQKNRRYSWSRIIESCLLLQLKDVGPLLQKFDEKEMIKLMKTVREKILDTAWVVFLHRKACYWRTDTTLYGHPLINSLRLVHTYRYRRWHRNSDRYSAYHDPIEVCTISWFGLKLGLNWFHTNLAWIWPELINCMRVYWLPWRAKFRY